MKIIKRRITWILGLSLLVRFLAVIAAHKHWFNTDSYGYIKQANAILSGQPFSHFPNGYPLIVALSRIIAGDSLFVYVLLFLNVVLSALSVVLAYMTGREVFGERVGLIIAVVLLFYPNQLNYVREIMSEVPAEFFLIAGLYAFLKGRFFISSILLMITCYIRTEFIPLILILGLILLLREIKLKDMYKFAASVLVMSSFMAVARYERIVKPPGNFGLNLLISINANSHDGLTFSTHRYSKNQISHPIETYMDFADTHPSQFISQRLWSLWELWGPWPGNGNNPRIKRGTLAKFLIGTRFIFLMLALFTVYRYRDRWEMYILLAPVFVITAVHFVFYSTPRYEYVVEPLVIILAVGGVKIICNTIRRKMSS